MCQLTTTLPDRGCVDDAVGAATSGAGDLAAQKMRQPPPELAAVTAAPARGTEWQTVTILDWDDTLLPTSYLFSHSVPDEDVISPALRHILRGIDMAAKRVLELSLCHGETYIITNAHEDWVRYTATKYLPEVRPFLDRVRIISARDRYEEENPADPVMWKEKAFLEVRKALDARKATNLISLGDSSYEMDAARKLGRALGWRPAKELTLTGSPARTRSLVKTIKLQEKPSAEELLKQLELVVTKFKQIVHGHKDLQIGLERKLPAHPSPSGACRSHRQRTSPAGGFHSTCDIGVAQDSLPAVC